MTFIDGWAVDLETPNFIAAVPTDKQREILTTERDAYISKGYDVQRAKQRLIIITDNNPNEDFTEQLTMADENLRVITQTVAAIDKQLAELNA